MENEESRLSSPQELTPGEAAEHLRVIRRLMERPISLTTRSGVAAIVAGCLALAGVAATWLTLQVTDAEQRPGLLPHFPVGQVVLIWLVVLVAAAVANVLIVRRRAGRLGHTWWRREQLQTGLAILPGIFLAAAVTAWLMRSGPLSMIPFAWMIGYGMALWSVAMFSIIEVRLLGAAFLAAGWVGVFLNSQMTAEFSLAMLAAAFGGFHLVYGLVVWRRHGG